MTDRTTTIAEVKRFIQDFSDTRGWRKEQNAKDLVMALTVEAAELAEIFMWLHSDEVDSIVENEKEFLHIKEELADVFWYVCRICEHFNIDLSEAVKRKMGINEAKYPIQLNVNENL